MFDLATSKDSDFILFIIILAGAILVLLLTRKLLKVSFPYFFLAILGLIIGLSISALASNPLSKLPGDFGKWLPIIFSVFITIGILDLFLAQAKSFALILQRLLHLPTAKDLTAFEIIVDTSVLIDGRIREIAQVGFVCAKLIVPKVGLKELQDISDSTNPMKRAKGRRGMEVLADLQKLPQVSIEIIDNGDKRHVEADTRIVQLAKSRQAKIITVDYNLNQIAQIQGIEVLNINQLTEAIKPSLIPGDELSVKVLQKGKEKDQGVGYLSDGTMIVIEGGDKYVGQILNCEVVRIYQTAAGKIIFMKSKKLKG